MSNEKNFENRLPVDETTSSDISQLQESPSAQNNNAPLEQKNNFQAENQTAAVETQNTPTPPPDYTPPTYQTQQPAFVSKQILVNPQNPNYVYPPNYTVSQKKDYTVLYSALCYISLLWIVGLLLDQKNPVVKFHINQGILLSIFSFGLNIVIAAVSSIIVFVFPAGVFITSFLSVVVALGVIILMILGIINAIKLKTEPLPIIGNLFTLLK